MGTTADKLNAVLASKNAIRDAITEKIGEDAGEVMSTYAEKIRGIESKPKYYRTTILIDQTITDPATMVTNVYDDGGIGMIRANSHRYVCKLVDGVLEAKQLQDGNGTLYLDGTTADLTGGEGDVFMKLPKFFYRAWSDTADKWYIEFVYGDRPSDDYIAWDDNHFVGVYEGCVQDSKLYSVSGVVSTGSLNHSTFKTYALNKGVGYSIIKWHHHCIMACLFLGYYKNTNCQSIVGAGLSTSEATGACDALGMEDTVAGINGDDQSINFWGLENWWGSKYEWIDGVFPNQRIAQVWDIEDSEGNLRSVVCGITGTAAYVSKFVIGPNLDLVPSAVGATSNSGFCDAIYIDSTLNRRALRSYAGKGTIAGVFMINANNSTSSAYPSASSRLCYYGPYNII